ncbi:MAG: hypothetical protein XE08_0356 [Parcubacteria bacterium 32_520]|nr:MAG: hypothetical protein XE08_0356 [Parcubacteria bacterium 32_520]
MALQLQKIFLGNTPSNQRKFATKLFKYLVEDYPKLIIPACGQFSLAKCAIEGGYKPENIYSSDISLFSSLLGYYYSGKSIWEIDFTLKDKYFEKVKKLKTETEQIAYIFLLMKKSQLYDDINVLKDLYDEIHNIDLKIASGIKEEDLKISDVNVKIDDVMVDLNFELINILFLDSQTKKLEEIIDFIDKDASVKIVDKKDFDRFAEQARKIAKRENIVNMAAIFSKMLDYVGEVIKLKEDIDKAENKNKE